ncbi:YbhB/YbcL family Raf kinase inhibitor-like protein [Palleronia rufa]|uniref:YbhB/YbcL family Raf kinase inhibitor-like protein n=1 Tax=Palleronia rufa TaxID=1530186 RepID=UPI00055A351E|nr:YbhB/YbcL family Raf kinase inhibitor-like protein [Palleronia rufa]
MSDANFTLDVPGIPAGGTIPERHVYDDWGCTGDNVSPALEWKDAPKGTKSFVVTVYDPDAPTGSGFWHWVVFDIPAHVTRIPEDAGNQGGIPDGAVQGRTDWGAPGYGGPVPPPGDAPHRYVFTVHALGVESLGLDDQASAAMVGFMTHQNSLGSATFEAFYAR